MKGLDLRSQREKTLFTISAVVSALAWTALVVSIVGLVYGLFIGFFLLAAHALFLAWVAGNGVRIGPNQLPEIHARIVNAARKLGLTEAPEVYVIQAGGILNAFAAKFLSRKFLILYSDLLEATRRCDGELPPDRTGTLDFIIGHELGHHAAGHLRTNVFLLPARIVPWLGPAYSRSCERTCDAYGHEVGGDLEVSSRALAILASGGETARQVSIPEFLAQRDSNSGFWASVAEINATHPFLSNRVASLRERLEPGSAPPVGRHPLAWPVAPLFGAATGASGSGLLVTVAMIGIIAAIAIPNLLNAIQRGKQKRTMADMRAIATACEAYAVDHNAYPAAASVDALSKELVPKYIGAVPASDAWATPFRFASWQENPGSPGPDSYALASAGKDAKWERGALTEYEDGATSTFDSDIVFSNGSFVRYPEGVQN